MKCSGCASLVHRILVKSRRAFDLSDYLREWLADAPAAKGGIRLEVDIDPQSFL